jgi:hypothetical protein
MLPVVLDLACRSIRSIRRPTEQGGHQLGCPRRRIDTTIPGFYGQSGAPCQDIIEVSCPFVRYRVDHLELKIAKAS